MIVKKILKLVLFCILASFFFWLVMSVDPSEDEIEQAQSRLLSQLNKDITRITIFCDDRKNKVYYKRTINDKKTITELLTHTKKTYGWIPYEGRYDQYYLIVLDFTNGEHYSFRYDKMYRTETRECQKEIRYNGQVIKNPFNDCGQLIILKDPEYTGTDHFHNSSPSAYMAFRNIDLIPFLNSIDVSDELNSN